MSLSRRCWTIIPWNSIKRRSTSARSDCTCSTPPITPSANDLDLVARLLEQDRFRWIDSFT